MAEPPLILCAEDEPQLRRDLCDELEAAGYRVVAAHDGADLLALLETTTPDLILCDIMMPALDGFGVLARFRRDHPHLAHVPLVFLSALSMTEAVIQGKRAGADDYLIKPVNYDLLLSTIEARLRQSTGARRALRQSAGLGQHLFDALSVGLVLFTPAGTVIGANAAAKALSADCTGTLRDDLAEAVRGVGLGAEAGTSDCRMLMLDDSRGRLACVQGCPADPVLDTPAMVLVFLTDPGTRQPLSAEALRALFQLTTTEARVVHQLGRGHRPDEIAQAMGVAPSTVAFHLRNCFAKTRTHRQADLVALALALPLRDLAPR